MGLFSSKRKDQDDSTSVVRSVLEGGLKIADNAQMTDEVVVPKQESNDTNSVFRIESSPEPPAVTVEDISEKKETGDGCLKLDQSELYPSHENQVSSSEVGAVTGDSSEVSDSKFIEESADQSVQVSGEDYDILLNIYERLGKLDKLDNLDKLDKLDKLDIIADNFKVVGNAFNVINSLQCEKDEIAKRLEHSNRILESKDSEIQSCKNEIAFQKQKIGECEDEINSLRQLVDDKEKEHAANIEQNKYAHEAVIADLEASHKEAIEQVCKSVDSFVPSEVCEMFDYRVGDECDDQARWQAIYAYLSFINGSLRQDVFVKRFRVFDEALYEAMRDTPELLIECRNRVQKHINERLYQQSGGMFVCWPNIGERFNPDCYTAISEFGQSIAEVVSAMVYKQDLNEEVICLSKGRVATK